MRQTIIAAFVVILLCTQSHPICAAATDISGWGQDRRLTFDSAASKLSYNFARSIAVDDSGMVHVVWYDARDGNEQVYYKRSADEGRNWSSDVRLSDSSVRMPQDPVMPAIAVSGLKVYVVWHEARNGRMDIYFRRSIDRGLTWEPVIQLSNGTGSSAHASIAALGSDVHVVWGDHRDGEQAEIYYKGSVDSGATWKLEKRLTDLPYDSWVPSLAVSGEDVYLAWVDTRDGNEEEYIKISYDRGVSWGLDTRLTNDPANSWAPSVAVSGKTVHLVWFDQRDSPVQPREAEKKLDGVMKLLGLSVEPEPMGVTVPNTEAAAKKRCERKIQQIQTAAPSWVARGGDAQKLQAIMNQLKEMMNGTVEALYVEKEQKMDEAMKLMGLSFIPGLQIDTPKIYHTEALMMRAVEKRHKILAAAPAWVARGGDPKKVETLMKEFERMMRLATTEWEIYYKRSNDGGATWGPDIRLTSAAGSSLRPSIAVYGDDLHIVWFDNRDGNFEIYYKHSFDGGTSWGSDIRLTNATGDSMHSAIAVSHNYVHVIWFDQRDGNTEIYYKQKLMR